MNRRQFLAASAAVAAGCSRPAGPPAADPDAARIAADRAERDRHLARLEAARVPAGATRTTPKPPADVLAAFPELKGLLKVAVRLHPRFGDEPGPGESKVGGRFLWPADEPWPERDGLPLAAVLQLRAEDAPPPVRFRPGTDLLQLLWLPRDPADGRMTIALRWRKRAAVGDRLADPPPADRAFLNYVPVPCRVFPERVTEFPDWDTLARTGLKEKLAAWNPPAAPGAGEKLPAADFYARYLAAARGTKVGGYPRPAGGPACPTCRWGMDYLLTVDSAEWDAADAARWRPVEDAGAGDYDGHRRAAGLRLGDGGAVRVFVCRRCEDWPAAAVL